VQKEIDPSSVKKIGILRANALGDFIVTLPAIESLRSHFKNAEIVLFGKEWHKNFCEDSCNGEKRTSVDRVIVVPVMQGIRDEKNELPNQELQEKFFAAAQQESFDIGISFQGRGISSIPFFEKVGAKQIVSLTSPGSSHSAFHSSYYYYQHEVLRYIDIVSLIGVKASMIEPNVKLLKKDVLEAQQFLARNSINQYISIHPCGSDNRRMWSRDKFKQLILELVEQGQNVVLTGSNSEKNYIQSIIPSDTMCVINSAGQLSLGGLAALYNLSKLVISVDTGPLHLAIAAGAKTIGMYWAPNVINWAPLSRVNHRPVINWELKCPKCGIIPNDPFPYEPVTSTCDHNVSFIDEITVDEVMTQIKLLLN
jgi:ADP-heptose:LPS heptosyltransferase